MLKKFWNYCKVRWAYLISVAFIWVIPIVMLNEHIALAETNIAFKLTFAGIMVLVVVFFALRKKISAIILVLTKQMQINLPRGFRILT